MLQTSLETAYNSIRQKYNSPSIAAVSAQSILKLNSSASHAQEWTSPSSMRSALQAALARVERNARVLVDSFMVVVVGDVMVEIYVC